MTAEMLLDIVIRIVITCVGTTITLFPDGGVEGIAGGDDSDNCNMMRISIFFLARPVPLRFRK